MNFLEYDVEARKGLMRHLDNRFERLTNWRYEAETRILRYLIFTNSGGAVTLLSFMGASEGVRGLLGIKIALCIFVLGLVLSGVLLAFGSYFTSSLFEGLKIDADEFYNNNRDWTDVTDNDDKRSEYPCWVIPLGYTAFGCFILGALIGLYQIFR